MVEVFIWRIKKATLGGDKLAIGHASMRVTGSAQAYISWWPTGTGTELRGSPAIRNRSFEADCSDEGHAPDRVFRFTSFFDEAKILQLWESWRKDSQFQMMFRNCSTTVRRLLCATGMSQFVQFTNFCSYDVITVPEDIEHYCSELEKILKAKSVSGALPGRWKVKVDRWTWIYDFDGRGGVRWTDSLNGMTGVGTWKETDNGVILSWAPASRTTEQWDVPLNTANQTGRCFMTVGNFGVKATRIS